MYSASRIEIYFFSASTRLQDLAVSLSKIWVSRANYCLFSPHPPCEKKKTSSATPGVDYIMENGE